MRRTNFNLIKDPSAWPQAIRLLESFLLRHQKVDSLWQQLPSALSEQDQRACRALVLTALRYGHCIDRLIGIGAKRPPKPRLRALLLLAGAEWLGSGLEQPDPIQLARTTDHAVTIAKKHLSQGEARFVNALLRRWPEHLQTHFPGPGERLLTTCPAELRKRWQAQFSAGELQQFLSWNLSESPTWVFIPSTTAAPPELTASAWPGYYKLPAGPLSDSITTLLAQGSAYIKDPGTRFAVDCLAVKPGEHVLDLCAAPGGKSFQIAHALGFAGQLSALDVPGPRCQRLRENIAKLTRDGFEPSVIEADLLERMPAPPQLQEASALSASLKAADKPLATSVAKVLIDVPCSNTGVLRRRPDVSWRLDEAAFQALLPQQGALLQAASRCVAANGTLVYSTCSIENDENQGVVEAFLQSAAGADFRLEKGFVHYPWQTGHDGGGVFTLKRNSVGLSGRSNGVVE